MNISTVVTTHLTLSTTSNAASMLCRASRICVQRRLFSTGYLLRSSNEQKTVPDVPEDSEGRALVREAIRPFQGKTAEDGSMAGIPVGSEEYEQRVRYLREYVDAALFDWMLYSNHESRNLAETSRRLEAAYPAQALGQSGYKDPKLSASRKKTQAALDRYQDAIKEAREHVLDLAQAEPPTLLTDPFKQLRVESKSKSASVLMREIKEVETNLKQDWISFHTQLRQLEQELDKQVPGARENARRAAADRILNFMSDDMDEPEDIEEHVELEPTASDHNDDVAAAMPTPKPASKTAFGITQKKQASPPPTALAQMRQRVTAYKPPTTSPQ